MLTTFFIHSLYFRQRRIAQEPRVEEVKAMNQSLALQIEELKKQEEETTRQKDVVTQERAGLVERNVREYPLFLTWILLETSHVWKFTCCVCFYSCHGKNREN
jgi:hypothetical protein